jgi:hypothetical protein
VARSDGRRPRVGAGRLVLGNLLVLVALLVTIEVAARVAAYVLRGSATAGLAEQQLNLTYEPFVMFGPKWDEQLAIPASDVPTVLLVGGSVAANFPVAILERALGDRAGHPVRVVNAAFGGYVARQEVIVASLWGANLRPTLLLSLDGHNDLDHRLRVPRAGTFFLDPTYRLYLTKPFLGPLTAVIQHSQAYNAIYRLLARRQVLNAESYSDAIPVFLNAQHSLNVLAHGMGASRLMVLQPFVGFRRQRAPEEAAFTAYQYREPVLKVLYEQTANGLQQLAQRDEVTFLDARAIFDDVDGAIFSDDVHFRDARGYELLARAIAAAVPPGVLNR